ncbi:hypothetical protein L195_g004092 [Trifolium pratense]|uniref:Uncharacterized protein n=1 Tax=Trifolium pratense TaxID=57577 RepID=A0A2K3NX20_TRIPR|nr:hypothetical protein L195_g004092 [Trifolium pratense]
MTGVQDGARNEVTVLMKIEHHLENTSTIRAINVGSVTLSGGSGGSGRFATVRWLLSPPRFAVSSNPLPAIPSPLASALSISLPS